MTLESVCIPPLFDEHEFAISVPVSRECVADTTILCGGRCYELLENLAQFVFASLLRMEARDHVKSGGRRIHARQYR